MAETETPGEEPASGADEPAHDVLAAEEFAMPAPDPRLHHRPVALPADPTGIEAAHDVLAAEEFAMPAPTVPVVQGSPRTRSESRLRLGAGAAAAALLAVLVRRRLRRG